MSRFDTRTRTRSLQLLEEISRRFEGPDLLPPESSDTDTRTLQIIEEMARRLEILPQRAGTETMATVTYTIGTTGRDYSTVTAWEADLDNGALYSSADDAVGEMYADSSFDEHCTMNGGGTVGLNSITLQAASGQEHDGTEGSGVRFVKTASTNCLTIQGSVPTTVKLIEFDQNGNANTNGQGIIYVNSTTVEARVDRCIIHGLNNTAGSGQNQGGIYAYRNAANSCYCNNFIYDLDSASNFGDLYGIYLDDPFRDTFAINNTASDINHTSATSTRSSAAFFMRADVEEYCYNNIGGVATHSNGAATAGSFVGGGGTANEEYNLSHDTTATGTGSLASKTFSNQVVSTTAGSEDFHLKTGADAIDAGNDYGTTYGSQVDIDGRDRDAEGDTWDIGAHEFVSGGGPSTSTAVFTMHYKKLRIV